MMNAVEKVCLELCEEIFYTSSATDKNVLNFSVNIFPDKEKTVEVVLITKDNEYTFMLDLPEEDVYSETDDHHYQCSKCASENKYKLKRINIKGFDVVEFGKVDLEYLKIILEKLAEDHVRCIEEKNLEKKCYKTGLFSVLEGSQQPFLDTLQDILQDNNSDIIHFSTLETGIKAIEKSYESTLTSDKEYVYVYSNILQKKLYVRKTNNCERDYKILNIRTEKNCPLVCDLLTTIFSYSDQSMRQHYFDALLEHYYQSLKSKLLKVSLDVRKILPQNVFERQIHEFNSYVKLDILKQMCYGFTKDKKYPHRKISRENLEYYKINIWPSLLELNECILYPNLSREDCYTILRNKIGSTDYKLVNYKLIPLDERQGFLGDYFKLKIEIEYNGEMKLFHLFAKYLPTYTDMVKELAADAFEKEEFYYRKFIPELNSMGLQEITNFLPSCYLSRTNEVLVFEDISAKNYKCSPVKIPYTYEMLSLTIKQLAKMHACSILYEEILSENSGQVIRLNEKFPEYVEEQAFHKREGTFTTKNLNCAERTFLDMLNVFPNIPKKLTMEEFKRRSKIFFDLCYEKLKTSGRYRNVLCQGDAWSSNILFKSDKDGLPIDCFLVDYQLTRYCPPTHDLYFLIYMTTLKETRKKFESKLLQEYYSELSNILQTFKVDLQNIYSYQEFLNCCEYMRSQGLCHAIMVLQFVLFPEEKLKDIVQDEEKVAHLFSVNRDIFVDELKVEGSYYKQRMMELIEDMYEICVNNDL